MTRTSRRHSVDRGAHSRGARRPRSMPWRLGGSRPRLWRLAAHGGLCGSGPVNTSLPAISGTLESGQALTATPGSWADGGATIPSYSYQWLLCLQYECPEIAGANSSTYTIQGADDYEQLAVAVTAMTLRGNPPPSSLKITDIVTYNGPFYTLSESTVGAGSVTGFETSPEAAGRTADANLTCPNACGALYPYLPGTRSNSSPRPRRAPPSRVGRAPARAALSHARSR